MDIPLRTLLAATSETPRLVLALQQGGFELDAGLADSPDALAAVLADRRWDVAVVVDGEVPASAVLSAVRASQLGLPVVVVAEAEAEAFPGAVAVVPPSALERLGPAVAAVLAAPTAPPVPAIPPPEAAFMPLDPAAADTPALTSSDASAVQALAEHLPIGLYQSTPDGRILFANEALAAVLDCASFEEMLRLDVRRDLGYPRDLFVEQIRRFGEVRNLIVEWTSRSGEAKVTRENARAVRGADGQVLYYEGTMEDVTAEHTARERERRRNAQLAAIVRFATAVDEAASVEDVYQAAVDAVSVSMGTSRVMLMVRRGDETRCVAWSEALPAAAVEVFHDLHIGALLPLHAEPVLLRDEQQSRQVTLPDEIRAVMRAHGARAVGSFPLIHHGCAHGAFIVLYGEPHTFTEEELQVAETLAWHVAGSLARHRAESGLRDSEACLRFIAENTAHVLYRLRHETGAFDYLSPAAEKLTGYSLDEIEALGGLAALVEAREVIQGHGLMEGSTGEGAGEGGESHYLAVYRMRTKGGESRYVENNAYLWYDAAGQAVGLVGVLQDVTERKRREDAQAAEATYALTLQKALVELAGLNDADPETLIHRATEVAAQTLGVGRALVWMADPETGAGHCLDLYERHENRHEEEPDLEAAQFQPWLEVHRQVRSVAVEDTEADAPSAEYGTAARLRRHGVRAALAAPIRQQGQPVGCFSLHHLGTARAWTTAEQDFAAAVGDLIALSIERSERQRAEAARHESDGRYRAISELASDYAFAIHVHPDGRSEIAWATDAFARVTGYTADEIDGLDGLLRLVHPGSAAQADRAFRDLEDGKDLQVEVQIVTKDGEERWVRHRARRVQEADGLVVLYHSGQDVTERKRFERELIAAREAAEELARLKSAFLANMSHEIRTPLTGILGYAGLLAEEVEGEHREFVQFIERSGRRLLDTLNSVLEMARLEANGIDPNLEVLDVTAEAGHAVRLLAPLAEQKGLDFELIPAGEPAHVRLDRTCFGRILTNLIGNAIKFTEEGRVSVEVEVEPADVRVRVRDTGVGVDPAFVPFLFDEFRQETAGQNRSHEGSGLGLAITKRLVELLGGAIHVESRRPGGTTFTVTFPRLAAAHHPDDAGDGAARHVAPPIIRPLDLGDAEAEKPTSEGDDMMPFGDLTWADDTPQPPASAPVDERDAPEADAADAAGVEPAAVFFEPDVLGEQRSAGHFDEAETPELETGEAVVPVALDPADLLTFLNSYETDTWDEAPFETSFDTLPEVPLLDAEEDDAEQLDAEQLDAEQIDAEQLDAEQIDAEQIDAEEDEPPAAQDDSFYASWDDDVTTLPVEPSDDDATFLFVNPSDLMMEPPVSPEAPAAAASEGFAPAAALGDDRPAILVVEDNDDTRMLLGRILQRHYRVEAAGDARAALERMARDRFDALVLDINLGGKQTGVDVLKVARAIPGYESVFAIALTAYALPGDRERFLEAGFDRYVSKPFTRNTLMAALSEGVPVEA